MSLKYFLGTYDYTLDDKNRLSIPAKFRKILSHLKEDTLMVTKQEDSCLTLYPYKSWESGIADRIAELPQSDDSVNRMRRILGQFTTDASLDNQGRIFLPANVCKMVGIEKQVKIFGCFNKIELWNPEKYAIVAKTPEEQSAKEELKKYRI